MSCCCPTRRTAWDEPATQRSFDEGFFDLLAAGLGVGDVARDLGISDQTVYDWRRQARIDRGLESGLTSGERAELQAARRRIRDLEAELAIHRKAAELLKGTTSDLR
jgi:transposase-like protein